MAEIINNNQDAQRYLMGKTYSESSNGDTNYMNPEMVEKFRNLVVRTAECLNIEYKKLITVNGRVCQKTGGNMGKSFESAADAVEKLIEKSKNILISEAEEIKTHVRDYRNGNEGAAWRADGEVYITHPTKQ